MNVFNDFRHVEIGIQQHELDDGKVVYGWNVSINNDDIVMESEYWYGSRLEAFKKAQSKLFGWYKKHCEVV